MFSFILSRLLQSLMVMLTVAFVAFSLFNFVGDPISNMVGQDTTFAEREALRERLGLNDPFIVQFGNFVSNAVKGDFGISYHHKQPVSGLIADRMPATLELSLVSAHPLSSAWHPLGGLYCPAQREYHFQSHHDPVAGRCFPPHLPHRAF